MFEVSAGGAIMVTWNPEWPGFNRRLPTPEGEEPQKASRATWQRFRFDDTFNGRLRPDQRRAQGRRRCHELNSRRRTMSPDGCGIKFISMK
jgi:hypothetical protein